MARYTGPVCRQCRREGLTICSRGRKCAIVKRDFPPGKKSWRRPRPTEYGVRLRETQKLKRYYGMMDRQFRRFYREAEKIKGNTGENLLILMERRLDNVVYMLGMAASRPEARQMVCHGHITVNGKKLDIPSCLTNKDDVIGIKGKSKDFIKDRLTWVEGQQGRELPAWLAFEAEQMTGKVIAMPMRVDVSIPVNEQLIVEFCSR